MSSDSDDYNITSAAKTRRYHQRRRAGIAPRPMATRTTLPLYTMESYGYPFNLTDQCYTINQI